MSPAPMKDAALKDAALRVSKILFSGRDPEFAAALRQIVNLPLPDAFCIIAVANEHTFVVIPPIDGWRGIMLTYAHRRATHATSVTATMVTGLCRPCGRFSWFSDPDCWTVTFDPAAAAAAIESLLLRRVTPKQGSVQ